MLSWPSVLLLGAGSYLLRLTGLTMLASGQAPRALLEPLRLLPPAILAALTVSMVVVPGTPLVGPRLVGVVAAAVLVWQRRSLVAAMVVAATLTALLRLVWP